MEYLRRRKTKEMIAIEEYLTSREDPCVLFPLSIEYEQHLYEIEHSGGPEALREYFQANGTQVSAMRTIIQQLYDTLNLITYYTITIQSNQREGTEFIQLKAWLFRQGLTAQEAANRKDVRISRKFIRMEVIPFFEYKAFDGDQLKLRMEGKVRQEGRKYIVNDGDIVEFFHHPL